MQSRSKATLHLRHLGIAALVSPALLLPIALALRTGAASPDPSPVASAAPAAEADPLAVELDRRLKTEITPLLAKYCLKCHTGEDSKGDVRLDKLLTLADANSGEIDLRMLREMVSTGEMPPKPKPGAVASPELQPQPRPQPTEHERLELTQWADAVLAYVPPNAAPDPGWFTIHRLNRTEYRLTLRDLLGIDPDSVDLAAKLPRDDTGYGFDNIADVLSTSPLAIEQYLDAAERAIDLAMGPQLELGDHPRDLRPLDGGKGGHAQPQGGFFLFTNGAATGKFTAPATGDYNIRISAWETHAGDDNSHLSLRIDKKAVHEFTVSANKENPQELLVRVQLKQGEHTIAAHFTNDFYEKDKGDRNLGVDSISVAGPLDEATTARPAARAQILEAGSAMSTDDAKAEAVLSAFATRAYRRPADAQQVRALLKVFHAQRAAVQAAQLAAPSGRPEADTFEPALRTALAATLVSPNFLFRSVGNQPGEAGASAARYTLDGYELASRLSYFLWSSLPDQALLAAAADGSLLTDAGLQTHTKRMLRDKRSAAFVENFSGQWLQLRALNELAIDRASFPEYTDALRADMATEATMFFADVLRSDRSVLEFLDSDYTFASPRLASFYGIARSDAETDPKGHEFRRTAIPADSPRGGVLTMAAVLTLTSNTTRTSPVKRGLFVLDSILGTPPPPPPADIPPLEQATKANPSATGREKLAAHVANATCASCHNRLDPLGLSFEHFDAIGRWRDLDNGQPVDASGTLPGGISINGSTELKANLMGRGDAFIESLSGKVLTYAVGRGSEPFDRPAIRQIVALTRAGGNRFGTLIEAVVLSDTFRTCRPRKTTRD